MEEAGQGVVGACPLGRDAAGLTQVTHWSVVKEEVERK